MNRNTYIRAEVSLMILIIVIVITFLSWFFVAMAYKTTETKKQLELRSLADAVTIYELYENSYPQSAASFNRWCTISEEYRGSACLEALINEGHVKELPTSPDEYPYQYQLARGEAWLGSVLKSNNEYDLEHTCYGNAGERMWCVKVK